MPQINYLIDEAVNVGKGANAIISMLHHFFCTYGLGETVAHLHADNCSGQNKNCYMMYYLMWRVLTKQHQEITISFLPVGHTKFFPDAGFGMLKHQFKRTKVGCLEDIVQVVKKSATINHCQLVGNQSGEVLVPTYDWADFFVEHTIKKALSGIKKFTTSDSVLVLLEWYLFAMPVIHLMKRRLNFLKICPGNHRHQVYHPLYHLMDYHCSASGICMIRSENSAHWKSRTWYVLCQGNVCHHPQMKRMNKHNSTFILHIYNYYNKFYQTLTS